MQWTIGFIMVVLGAVATAPARSAEPVWKPWLGRRLLTPEEARGMIPAFIDRHLQALPVPASREAWLSRRDGLRKQVLDALGIADLVPPRWDLRIQHRGVIRREGYRIEKLTFDGYPGMAVPALLYVPEQIAGRVPGIVSIAGHVYAAGKAADFLQQRNVNLAKRGCVVLAYDYLDCGERNTGEDPMHGKPYGGGNDHGIASFSFSLRNPTGLEVLDAIRALDVLLTRPEVDPYRLGFTGESGGGNSTYWVAAVDPRVVLAVPVSSVTTFDYWIRKDRNWDWHQRPAGIRRVADIGTLLALHAPNPLLVISSRRGTDDHEFPLEEADQSVAWARQVYGLLDAEHAIMHIESSTAHGYQVDKREQLYEAVERWLKPPRPKGRKELPAELETLEQLRCGLPPGNLTFRDIFRSWLEPLPRTSSCPTEAEMPKLRNFLRERLGWPEPAPPIVGEKVAEAGQGEFAAEFYVFQSEPGIRLPGVLVGKKGHGPAIMLVPGRDTSVVARAVESGNRAFAFDPRATGEIADDGRLRNFAWFFGRPLVGMWAWDIQQAARFLKTRFPGATVRVDAAARFAWPALLSGAGWPGQFESGTLALEFSSLRQIIHQRGDAALADVPGLLEWLDVPQIRTLGPAATCSR